MKKIFLILFGIVFLTSSTSFAFLNKNSNWEKVANNIYLDIKSLTIKNEINSARFKIYASKKNNLFNVDKKKVRYEIVFLEAYCKNGVLEIKQVKTYDKNHNLLKDEINTYGIGCDYKGLVNGEIYYNSLCKSKR